MNLMELKTDLIGILIMNFSNIPFDKNSYLIAYTELNNETSSSPIPIFCYGKCLFTFLFITSN